MTESDFQNMLKIADCKNLTQPANELYISQPSLSQSIAKITPKICYTTKSMETSKRLVATGLGVTFLQSSYLHLFSGTDNIVNT